MASLYPTAPSINQVDYRDMVTPDHSNHSVSQEQSSVRPEPANLDQAQSPIERAAAQTPSSASNQSKYTGPGVVPRNLVLELVDVPESWSGKKQPDELGIDTISIPVWMNGADDVPTYDELIACIQEKYHKVAHPTVYKVDAVYRWEEISGRDKKTGKMVDKVPKKRPIASEADLRSTWLSFSWLPLPQPLELFFELAPLRTTGQVILLDTTPPRSSVNKRSLPDTGTVQNTSRKRIKLRVAPPEPESIQLELKQEETPQSDTGRMRDSGDEEDSTGEEGFEGGDSSEDGDEPDGRYESEGGEYSKAGEESEDEENSASSEETSSASVYTPSKIPTPEPRLPRRQKLPKPRRRY